MSQPSAVLVVPGRLVQPQRWHVGLLVGLALSLGLLIGAQAATTWTVCASGCDYTSIKAAIAASTTHNGDTLAIAAGTYTEAGIIVNKSLTLQGEDADTTIVQAATTPRTASDRVFTIPNGVTVTLQALTIRYGNVVGDGGGVWNGGTLTLTTSTVRGNRATRGSRLSYGGGLYNQGTLTLTNSTVASNVVGSHGGGLFNDYGVGPTWSSSTTLTNSTVRDNTAGCCGGGLWNDSNLRLTNSTVRDNTAGVLGGGLYDQGYTQLTNSTVSHNSAAQGGGLASYWGGSSTVRSAAIGLPTAVVSTSSPGWSSPTARSVVIWPPAPAVASTTTTPPTRPLRCSSLTAQ